VDAQGHPFVLEINSMASLGQGGAYVLAARAAGYSFADLACRIVDCAHERYFGKPATRDVIPMVAATEDVSEQTRLKQGGLTA
jgi:hypothetical protein